MNVQVLFKHDICNICICVHMYMCVNAYNVYMCESIYMCSYAHIYTCVYHILVYVYIYIHFFHPFLNFFHAKYLDASQKIISYLHLGLMIYESVVGSQHK